MKKIKTIIADDEFIIRKGIKKLLSNDLDLDVLSEAEDGEIALDLVSKEFYDLAIVDINMPFLNGLEFIEKIKEISPNTIVIIISGFDEFEYAQKAIRLGVQSYLLKPVNEDKLFREINTIKNIIKERNNNKEFLDWAKDELLKNKSVLINQFLGNLLSNHIDTLDLNSNLINLDLNLRDNKIIYILKCSCNNQLSENVTLLFAAIKKIAANLISEEVIVFDLGNSKFLLIPNGVQISEIQLNSLIKEIQKRVDIKVSLKSKTYKDLESFVECEELLENELDKEQSLPRILKSMIAYIKNNYMNKELTLSMMADELGVTPQYLSRQINKYMNTTFINFLNMMRIESATYLIKNTDKLMYEIADEVGYSSQHYFSRAFKKIRKVSPINYQMEFKNDK